MFSLFHVIVAIICFGILMVSRKTLPTEEVAFVSIIGLINLVLAISNFLSISK